MINVLDAASEQAVLVLLERQMAKPFRMYYVYRDSLTQFSCNSSIRERAYYYFFNKLVSMRICIGCYIVLCATTNNVVCFI